MNHLDRLRLNYELGLSLYATHATTCVAHRFGSDAML
jgi:hypothetical protein